MALDRWIALAFIALCCVFGYTAFFTMDDQLPPILRRNPVSPQREWGERVARDLFLPSYKIGFLIALRARLLRNYWGVYAVLLFSWLLKILIYPGEAHTWAQVKTNMSFGMIPWWIPLVYIGAFVVGLVALVALVPSTPPADNPAEEFWVETPIDSGGKPADV
jgi:uncharacterized membrane protein